MKLRHKLLCLTPLLFLIGLSKIRAEELSIFNFALTTQDIHSTYMFNRHQTNSLEGFDLTDNTRDSSSPTNQQWLNIYSIVDSKRLRRD